jgi:anaerobic selenocysteine-containing dehydrogenase
LEILIHFGHAFHGDEFAYKSVEDYLDKVMAPHGSSWEEISKNVSIINTLGGYRKHERGLIRSDGQVGFQTPTGRVELYSIKYQQLGDDPLPYYVEPVLAPDQNPQYAKAYPLIMTTGARHFSSFHSEHRQIPSLRALNPEPRVELHPRTAAEYCIHDGDLVFVENPWGKAKLRALVTPTIRPDVINSDHGWWFPEQDGEEPNLFGVWKSNLNEMIPHKTIGKMGFGAPYKCLPATIYKAEN